MNCRYCGAQIGQNALFCMTCGRLVEGDGTPRSSASRGDGPPAPPAPITPPSAPLPPPSAGETPFASLAAPNPDDAPVDALAAPGGDEAETGAPAAPAAPTASAGSIAPADSPLPPRRPIAAVPELQVPSPRPDRCPQCLAVVSTTEVFCRTCGFVLLTPTSPSSDDTTVFSGAPVESPYEPLYPTIPPDEIVVPRPAGAPLPTDVADAAQGLTQIAGVPLRRRDRFVLQFSTGESVICAGSGLIGRNPTAEPGERIDQLVVVGDAGKSVSKTHLEFGQEDGEFWICDRWSTNGTVIRVPGADGRRAEAGHRYRVPRGTRIEIGDQFFVVS